MSNVIFMSSLANICECMIFSSWGMLCGAWCWQKYWVISFNLKKCPRQEKKTSAWSTSGGTLLVPDWQVAFLEVTAKQVAFHDVHSHVLTVTDSFDRIVKCQMYAFLRFFQCSLYQHKKVLLQLSVKTFLRSCGRFWQNFKQAVTALLWNKAKELGLILIIPPCQSEYRLVILDLTWLADQSTGSTTHIPKMTPMWLEQAVAQYQLCYRLL